MRVVLFVVLAAALTVYSFWIYERVELAVPAARRLAIVRACSLVLLLLLLFDPRLPAIGPGAGPVRWALVDASLSMAAVAADGTRPWDGAATRARELEGQGWNVVRFGDGPLRAGEFGVSEPDELGSRLSPALQAAAEAGARQVRVLSDLRFEDAVAVRAAVETLPMDIRFERFGGTMSNTGLARFAVPDLLQADGHPVAEVEVYGGVPGDSIEVEISEEGRPVGTLFLPPSSEGLRSAGSLELPVPATQGRLRYTARVVPPSGENGQAGTAAGGDGFPDDDQVVTYTNVGYEAGALVMVSLQPDWEPRYLLPVLQEVTGLSAAGYLRAGDNRFVQSGRAADRGGPVDSVTVRTAAANAALLVVHGLGAGAPAWITTLVGRPGRRLILPTDASGATAAGLEVTGPRTGEWYVSPDIATSPIAGSLSGVSLQGLPPLTDVFVPDVKGSQPPLQLQLRGAGAPESAFALLQRSSGRIVVVLASGFWRWSMRDAGREPYRRVWSGVAGWLLADERFAGPEARPALWVVPRGAPVEWRTPGDSVEVRIVVRAGDSVVVDTTATGRSGLSTGVLPPGAYEYAVLDEAGDSSATGRFDVGSATLEMLPTAGEPEVPARAAAIGVSDAVLGRPLRTRSWPYLLVLVLLCGEWVVRRRSGLR